MDFCSDRCRKEAEDQPSWARPPGKMDREYNSIKMEKSPVIRPEDVPLPEDDDLDDLPTLPPLPGEDIWPPNPPSPPTQDLSWEEAFNELIEACERSLHVNVPCLLPALKEEVQGLLPLSVLADIPLPADDEIEFALDEEVVQPPISLQSEASLDNQQVKMYLDFPSLDNGDEQQAVNTATPVISSSQRRPWRRRNKQWKGPYAPNHPQDTKKPDLKNIQFSSLYVDPANMTPLQVPAPQHPGSNGPLSKTVKKRRGEHPALENSSGAKHRKQLHDLTVQPMNPTPMKKKRSRRNRRKRNYDWNSEALRLRKPVKKQRRKHPALGNGSGAKHQQVKMYLDLSRIGFLSLENGDEQQAVITLTPVISSSRRRPWRRRNKQWKGPYAPSHHQDKKKPDLKNIQFPSLYVDPANMTPLQGPAPQHPGSSGFLRKNEKKRRGEHPALGNSSGAKHQKLLHDLTMQPANPTPIKKKRSRRNRRKRNCDLNSEAPPLDMTPGLMKKGAFFRVGNKIYRKLSKTFKCNVDDTSMCP